MNIPLSLSGSISAAHLTELRTLITLALPDTNIAPGTHDMGQSTLTISLPNGVDLLASEDTDLPWLLFEIVRYFQPGNATIYPFEGCASPSYAFTDKLSGQGVVDLIGQYARLPTSAPVTSQS